jgi:hypothetical protein
VTRRLGLSRKSICSAKRAAMPDCTIDLRTDYARLPRLVRPMPALPWSNWKRSLVGRAERWLRFTLALQIGDDWHKARCTSSQERLTNKRYPHLSGKLPAPRKILSKNKLIIFAWWGWEDSNF